MQQDVERQILRHLVATIVMRGRVGVDGAPDDFAVFRVNEESRSPAEILAHIGDLLEGSYFLMSGEMIFLASSPLEWSDEVARFLAAAKKLDGLVASNAELHQPIKKLIQGPIADALTHIGQIIMLRRLAGFPTTTKSYFEEDLVLGKFS